MVLFFNSENRDFILDQILMVSYLYVRLPLNRNLYKNDKSDDPYYSMNKDYLLIVLLFLID